MSDPVETLEARLARIRRLDGKIHAFLWLEEESVRRQAEEIRKRQRSGERIGPLAGVPVAIKDNLCVRGAPTTCGSKILSGYIAPYDATVIRKLRAAGAVLLGKTNLDEFAMGSSTENSAFGPTRNPWNPETAPGGSSGGSAAAVAAGFAPLALGSDTGGSIRQPAALCGVVGMKPTYGRVSRYGLIAFASSLDQIGPFARTAWDAALLLSVIAGHDPMDSTSSAEPVPDYLAELRKAEEEKPKWKIGIPKEYFGEGVDPEVAAAVREAVRTLEKLGCSTMEISLPHTDYGLACYYILAPSEASANLARYDGIRYGLRSSDGDLLGLYEKTRGEGFGPEVKRRIMLGTFALSSGYYEAYYGKAQKVRTLIARDFEEAFRRVDLIATPTSPTPAFRLGERTQDPLSMYRSDVCTIPCNLAGLPGISVPCGFTKSGLPIGLQMIGRPFDESRLLAAGHLYQKETDWHRKEPPLAAAAA